jgi:hypothetical protein
MKTLSQVLHQALRSLEKKYHQKKTGMPAREDAAPPFVKPPAPPVNLTNEQREVLRRFMHLRGH